jgi:hypothetical protein
VIIRVADGGKVHAAEKEPAQFRGSGFVSQADGMNNFGAIQFPHRFRVIDCIGDDWMCRDGNASLPVHFVYGATGLLFPIYRVPDTDSE